MSDVERALTLRDFINETVSPSFCMAKWHHTTIYLQTGMTHSCYHPAPHKIPLEGLAENPSQLHNTPHKKQERKQMLEGERCVGCQYCWNVEDLGEDYVSDRVIRGGSLFTHDRMAEIKEKGVDFNVNPDYIEIAFSNECNFKCGYCHPNSSSSFMNEIKKHGPYDMVKNHRLDIDWFKAWEEDDNPYVKAWWEWWPEVSKTLNILRITGGEPLMHKSTWRLFDELIRDPKPHMELNINSNMGVKTTFVENLAANVNLIRDKNAVKQFALYTSIDCWNERAEYIRTGLDLELWEKNLDIFATQTKAPVNLMITFNALTVSTFKTLLEKILEWRSKYDGVIVPKQNDHAHNAPRTIRFDTPYLKEPLHYDMNILPKDEFMPYMTECLDFIKSNIDDRDSTKFQSVEYEKFRRVHDYMLNTHYSDEKIQEGRKDFYNWFNEYDRRRGTNFLETFPEYEGFMKLCQTLTI